jgi:tetratricopeptide (TPR) repeat protein
MSDDFQAQLDSARGTKDWIAAANICEFDLLDLEQAIECWQKAFEVDSNNVKVLDGLERLYKVTAHWDQLATVLEHRLQSETDRERKMNALRSLVETYRDQLGDQERAQDAARRLVELTV